MRNIVAVTSDRYEQICFHRGSKADFERAEIRVLKNVISKNIIIALKKLMY